MANKKYDLSKWKYSELRDAINTSCDIELLEVSFGRSYLNCEISYQILGLMFLCVTLFPGLSSRIPPAAKGLSRMESEESQANDNG